MDVKNYIIRQISVFSENKPGRLASIAKAFQEEKNQHPRVLYR